MHVGSKAVGKAVSGKRQDHIRAVKDPAEKARGTDSHRQKEQEAKT